jgi:enterobacterial common antigen flippase
VNFLQFRHRGRLFAPQRVRAQWCGLRQSQNARDVILTTGGKFTIALFMAVAGIIAARLLGPSGRGTLAVATVWAGILGTLAQVGLSQSLIYYVAKESESFATITVTGLTLLVVQSVIILPIGWAIVGMILGRGDPMTVETVRIYLFSIPFSLLTTYLSAIAQGLKRFKLFNALQVAGPAGYLVSLLVCAAFHLNTARAVVTVMLASQVIVACVATAWFVTHVPILGSFQRSYADKLLTYGFKSYLANISWLANARLDQFIMSAFVGLAQLGQYAVAVSYASLLFPLSTAFAAVLFPKVASDAPQKAPDRIRRTLRLNLGITGSGALILALACPFVLPLLFGAEFKPAVLPAIILLFGTVLLGCNYVMSDGLRGLGRPLWPSIAEAIGVAVTVAGLTLLLRQFGIVGAAVVSVAAYLSVLFVLSLGLRNVSISA